MPTAWIPGIQYDREAPIAAGSLVGIKRSDGTIKFGQVVKKAGFFYQDAWEVVVTMNNDGTPAATRVEEGMLLIRPKPDALAPVVAAMPTIVVNEKSFAETKGDKGFLGNMFGSPSFEGGEGSPSAPPAGPPKAAAPPAKAVVPMGIIPGPAKAAPPPPAPPPAPPAPPQASVPQAPPVQSSLSISRRGLRPALAFLRNISFVECIFPFIFSTD